MSWGRVEEQEGLGTRKTETFVSALPALTFVGMEVDHQGQGRCQKHPDEWRQSRQQSRLQAFQRPINASNGLPVQHHQGDTVPFWAPDQKWPKGVCGQVNQRQCPDPSEIRQSSWRIRMVPVSRSGTGYVLGKQGDREATVAEPYRRWQWVPARQTSVDSANRPPGGLEGPLCLSSHSTDTQEPQRRLEPGRKSSRPSADAAWRRRLLKTWIIS